MMLLKEPAGLLVIQAAALWRRGFNSQDIAEKIAIPEHQVMRLIDEARQRAMIA